EAAGGGGASMIETMSLAGVWYATLYSFIVGGRARPLPKNGHQPGQGHGPGKGAHIGSPDNPQRRKSGLTRQASPLARQLPSALVTGAKLARFRRSKGRGG